MFCWHSPSAVDLRGHSRKHSPEEGLLGRSSADLEYQRPKQNLTLVLNAFQRQRINLNLVCHKLKPWGHCAGTEFSVVRIFFFVTFNLNSLHPKRHSYFPRFLGVLSSGTKNKRRLLLSFSRMAQHRTRFLAKKIAIGPGLVRARSAFWLRTKGFRPEGQIPRRHTSNSRVY